MPSKFRSRSGFSLLEIVVVVAIAALLAALLLPNAKALMDESKVSRIVELANTLREACMRFHQDTDQYALEDSGTTESPKTDAANHKLSMAPPNAAPIPGWKGPYIAAPLSFSNNPFGGRIVVGDSTNWADTTFDVLGNGAAANGPANVLVVGDVPYDIAKLVDERLDPQLPGAPDQWTYKGRVVTFAIPGGSSDLSILLYGP